MISKLIESFATEMQKEETQEYISEILSPYIYKYKYYLFLISLLLVLLFISSFYNTYLIYKLTKHLNNE